MRTSVERRDYGNNTTVTSAVTPSKNFSVPRRVSTLPGVVMDGGIGVVIFIFGLVCA